MRFLLTLSAVLLAQSAAFGQTCANGQCQQQKQYVVRSVAPPADCGCIYSDVPVGLLGTPCVCNPTGQTRCRCGSADDRPDVPIRRGMIDQPNCANGQCAIPGRVVTQPALQNAPPARFVTQPALQPTRVGPVRRVVQAVFRRR